MNSPVTRPDGSQRGGCVAGIEWSACFRQIPSSREHGGHPRHNGFRCKAESAPTEHDAPTKPSTNLP